MTALQPQVMQQPRASPFQAKVFGATAGVRRNLQETYSGIWLFRDPVWATTRQVLVTSSGWLLEGKNKSKFILRRKLGPCGKTCLQTHGTALKVIPHSLQPSFFPETGRFPWVSGGFLERRIHGKNGNGRYP